MEKWFLKGKELDLSGVASKFKISEVVARLAVNRGITTNEEMHKYLNGYFEDLYNPKEMKDLVKATNVLKEKIESNMKIRVVGDYDVDGVIATYLLTTALKKCNANVDYEIPDRIKDGYGINQMIIQNAYDDGVDTIITCDNGIAAIDQIEYAREKGMTVIITDHHDIPYKEEDGEIINCIPNANAIVNHKQEDCLYPFNGLCGAAVAYKLIQHLYSEFGIAEKEILELIQYVAIATVCDVMDLVDENRIFVKMGLDQLRTTNNIGLEQLIIETGLDKQSIGVYHLGFIIGPCINASGRLESAKIGLEMLLCEDVHKARELAKNLKSLNDERKDLTAKFLEESIKIVEESSLMDDTILVVYLPGCHESIAGIIAGRLKERYYKPTIVLTNAEHGVKGSARSIEGYDIFKELNKCKDLLDKFGGHPMAAGLSLKEENVELLRERLNELHTLTKDDLSIKVSIDMMLKLNDVTENLINEMSILEPYGRGNAKPLFVSRNVSVIKAVVLGVNKNVLKLTVRERNQDNIYTAMIFQGVESFEQFVKSEFGEHALNCIYDGVDNNVELDIVYYPDINEYKGYKNIQFIVQQYRRSTC